MDKKIRDNQSTRELSEQIVALGCLVPFLPLLGLRKEQKEFKKIRKEAKRLLALPDKYNERLSKHGWIAHESLSPDIMEKAIEIHDQVGFEEAEQYLIKSYEKEFNEKLKFIISRTSFFRRKRLIESAYQDYKEKRYYASVPVILILLDGIVNDIKETGLFSENTDYEVWDSISGHNTGLKEIMKIYNEKKTDTNTEEVLMPHRHGILHGLDINYNNRIVAIKSFALLYYISDWLREVATEKERQEKYRIKREKSKNRKFSGVLKDISNISRRNEEDKSLLKKWVKRRAFTIEQPQSNKIDINMPEFVSVIVIENIIKNNFAVPVKYYSKNLFKDVSMKNANILRESFNGIKLEAIDKIVVEDKAAAKSDVIATVRFTNNNNELETKELKMNMIYEINEKIENRLKEGGIWTVINLEGLGYELKRVKKK